MLANISVHEPKPRTDPDSPLAFSMEGSQAEPPSALVSHVWAPGWNSVQALNKFQSEIGGEMRGGAAGVRFLTSGSGDRFVYCPDVPAPFQRSDDRLYVAPLYHIFGSEELSMLSPAVAERAGAPYIALSPSDAETLGLESGFQARLAVEGVALDLTVRIIGSLPAGVAGLPVGLPGLEGIAVPAWGTVTRTS
jgi:NADH-quinone oxidoreductase subunit G